MGSRRCCTATSWLVGRSSRTPLCLHLVLDGGTLGKKRTTLGIVALPNSNAVVFPPQVHCPRVGGSKDSRTTDCFPRTTGSGGVDSSILSTKQVRTTGIFARTTGSGSRIEPCTTRAFACKASETDSLNFILNPSLPPTEIGHESVPWRCVPRDGLEDRRCRGGEVRLESEGQGLHLEEAPSRQRGAGEEGHEVPEEERELVRRAPQ